MAKFGPYDIGETIPDSALIGTDLKRNMLYAVVGEFPANVSVIPAFTDRQQINAFGVVQDYQFVGPETPSRVTTWGMIPKDKPQTGASCD
jgi:hypothetical protein